MVTKEQAQRAEWRTQFRHVTRPGVVCRVNGKCRTWKRRPEAFLLPVKYGIRECFYITPSNAHEWEPA